MAALRASTCCSDVPFMCLCRRSAPQDLQRRLKELAGAPRLRALGPDLSVEVKRLRRVGGRTILPGQQMLRGESQHLHGNAVKVTPGRVTVVHGGGRPPPPSEDPPGGKRSAALGATWLKAATESVKVAGLTSSLTGHPANQQLLFHCFITSTLLAYETMV